MKKRIVTLTTSLALLAALTPVSVLAAEHSCSDPNPNNLLVNPCAESGMSGWSDPQGQWGTDDGSGTVQPKCGANVFSPLSSLPGQDLYQIYQNITLPGTPGTITLTAWTAAGEETPMDLSCMVLQLFDVNGKLIGESSASNESLDHEWHRLRLSGEMSAGIYGARVVLQSLMQTGPACNSYFDHLELTFRNPDGSYYTSQKQKPEETGDPVIGSHSPWAEKELKEAAGHGLIPVCLQGKDLTKTINRTEFAAVAVKLYESVSGKTAQAPGSNPFFDTADPEVLKAYGLGIINGTGKGTFSPTDPLTREQAAVILVRAYNAARGTSLKNQNADQFADHKDISGWARDSVYTMAAYGVINGVGEGRFAPKGQTSREQALLIAGRSLGKIPSDPGPAPEPVRPQPDGDRLSAEQVYKTLMSFQSQYPEGTPWDNSKSYTTGAYANEQRTGYGCSAFSYILSDGVFGDLPVVAQYDSFSLIRPGDNLRTDNNTHHVTVLRVLSDSIIVAEANYNGTVHWGREISRAELEAGRFIGETRYPM